MSKQNGKLTPAQVQAIRDSERLRSELARARARIADLEAQAGRAVISDGQSTSDMVAEPTQDTEQPRAVTLSRGSKRRELAAETLFRNYNQQIDRWMGLTLWEIKLIMAQIWVKAHAVDLRGEPLIVALRALRPALESAWQALEGQINKQGDDPYVLTGRRAKLNAEMIAAIDRALPAEGNPTPDDGAALRAIPFNDEQFTPAIIAAVERQRQAWQEKEASSSDRIQQAKQEAAAERAKAESAQAEADRAVQRAEEAEQRAEQIRLEAKEAKSQESIRKSLPEEQQLIKQCVDALRLVRPERPDYSLERLRDHYVSKYEGRVSPDSLKVFEKIRAVTDRTLRNWRETYGDI